MKSDLFDDFASVSAKQWKQKIQYDLKGADYNEVLLTTTGERIQIRPFYHRDTYRKLNTQKTLKNFKISQTVFIDSEKIAGKIAQKALKKGAEAIKFVADRPFDINTLFEKLKSKGGRFYFKLNFIDQKFFEDLLKSAKDHRVFLNIDIFGNLVRTGNWFSSNQNDHQELADILKFSDKRRGILGVDISVYQNAGANNVQQTAYALAHANEYLNFMDQLVKKGELTQKAFKKAVKNMVFTFATGNNYFFEIAKLKAFRYLWSLLLKEYGLKFNAHIFSVPSLRNKTIYDANVNMLRTTAENMAAIFGGANTVSNIAYDSIFVKNNDFGERIARNQLLILKEESLLKNGSFAEGAYYIEEIAFEIAEKALEIFKGIEKNGGFLTQLYKGTIQRKIAESAKKEQLLFDSGELVLLGTNKYPDANEKISKNDLELFPFVKKKRERTEIEPVIPKRLAEEVEQKRIQ